MGSAIKDRDIFLRVIPIPKPPKEKTSKQKPFFS